MDIELQKRLIKRFPILYRSSGWSMRRTAMCWGFECGDGWFLLVWFLSTAIEEQLKQEYSWFSLRFPHVVEGLSAMWRAALKFVIRPPLEYPLTRRDKVFSFLAWYPGLPSVTQVKEKYGTLRFYMSVDEDVYKFISLAEYMSSFICEECGKRGQIRAKTGWLYTACTEHVREPIDYTKEEKRDVAKARRSAFKKSKS